MMKKQISGVLLAAVLLAGCATDRGRTQVEGAGVGALGGAALGALGGYAVGGGKGAAIGAAAGAAVGAGAGYAYGTHVANQKERYAREEDYLDAMLVSAQQMNEETRQYNASLRDDIRTLDRETAMLAQQYNSRTVKKSALQKEEKTLTRKISEAQQQLGRVRYELDTQRSVLAHERGLSKKQLRKLESQVAELERNKSDLEQQINRLASMKTRVTV